MTIVLYGTSCQSISGSTSRSKTIIRSSPFSGLRGDLRAVLPSTILIWHSAQRRWRIATPHAAAKTQHDALDASEYALALNPNSRDARYNFALALRQGGFYLDAAEELERLLTRHPLDTRARLALANLYAQQLRQPARARLHYQRLLELDPRHPEAEAIRYWLAQHPG